MSKIQKKLKQNGNGLKFEAGGEPPYGLGPSVSGALCPCTFPGTPPPPVLPWEVSWGVAIPVVTLVATTVATPVATPHGHPFVSKKV